MERVALTTTGRAALFSEMTRERWLEQAVVMLDDLFQERGFPLPPVRVACGWPGGLNARKAMGQCWSRAASSAGINEIFISPLYQSGFDVLGTLVHELCHAVDDCKSGHGREFARIARTMGLVGKLTSCGPGEWMTYECKLIEEALGPYPHSRMTLKPKPKQPKNAFPMKISCSSCSFEFSVGKAAWATVADDLYCPSCCAVLDI